MDRIVNDLKKLAGQFKNCDGIEHSIRNSHSNLKGLEPPIILTMASGFLYKIPREHSITLIDEQPHLVPFKKSIMSIIDGVKTNNPFIETSRSIVYSL